MPLTNTRRHFKFVIILALFLVSTLGTSVMAQDGGGGEQTAPPISYKLNINNLRHEYQGWNNCGPTTMTMSLSYFGYGSDQKPAASFMKPHYEDKNVNPWEMTAFVNEQVALNVNVRALYRPAGDMQLLKALISNEFPVIIEEGYEPEGYDWMGHYLFLMGYDDTEQVFYAYDSFLGHGNFQGLKEDYAEIEEFWWHFNNTFIVLYAPEREEYLMDLLGERADLTSAYQYAFNQAQARAGENPDDNWAWYNAGEALTKLGYHPQATDFFTIAFDLGMPWRTLWYRHTPFEAYYNAGKFNTVIQLVQSSKLTTPYVEEFHYWHGMVFASQGRTADARAQFSQALTHNTNYQAAKDRIAELDAGTFVPVQQTDG